MKEILQFIAVFAFAVIFLMALILTGFKDGKKDGIKEMQKQAIELGYAEYNKATGEWQWKEKGE